MKKIQYYEEEAEKLGLAKTYFKSMPSSTRNRLKNIPGEDIVQKYKNLLKTQEKEIEKFLSIVDDLAKKRKLKSFALFLTDKNVIGYINTLQRLRERAKKKRGSPLIKEDTLNRIIEINNLYPKWKKSVCDD